MELAQWHHAKEREISCHDCIETKWMMSKTKPDCIKCGYILCLPENQEVMRLIFKYFAFMFSGFGTPNILAIEAILDREGLLEDHVLYDKLLIYMKQAIKTSNNDSRRPNKVYAKKGTIAR